MLAHKYTDMRQTTSVLLRNAACRDTGKQIKRLSSDGGWEPCFALPQELLQLHLFKEIVPATGQKNQPQGQSFVF